MKDLERDEVESIHRLNLLYMYINGNSDDAENLTNLHHLIKEESCENAIRDIIRAQGKNNKEHE